MIRPHLERLLNSARAHVPHRLLPLLVALRFRVAWSRESVRADARRQMAFLLEAARPDADLEAAARAYVRRMIWRGEARWHPEIVTRIRVEGIEHLEAARDTGRGVVLSCMHQGYVEGTAPSMARHGVTTCTTSYPTTLQPEAAAWIRQHVEITCSGGNSMVSTKIGSQGITDLLDDGLVVIIACDVPGRTPVRFAGRDLLGSFGAARLAFDHDSPVVMMTAEADRDGELIRLHEAIEPRSFESPRTLLTELLARHEVAVLRWPETVDLPLSRWGAQPVDSDTA